MLHQRLTFVLYICYFAVLFCVSAQFHGSNKNDIKIHLFPAYAIASRADLLGSTTCGMELRDLQNAIDERLLWSLKILDSSGGPKSGFFYGNNFWLGSRSQCFETTNKAPFEISYRHILNDTLYRDPQNEFPPFEVNYFVAHLRHNSTLQYHIHILTEDIITLGLCLPASCSVNNVSFILETIIRDRVLLINDLYSIDLSLIQVKDLKDDHQWLLSGMPLLICIVLMLTFFMMISGTIYDLFIYQKYLKAKSKTDVSVINEAETMEMIDSSFLRKEKNKLGDILMCFSVYTNTKILFDIKLDSKEIPVIYGIRFFSMLWIILLHSVYFNLDYIDNKTWMLRFTEGFLPQVLKNSTMIVDTYFFLSGLLLTYTYLKNKTDKELKPINCGDKLNEFFVGIIRRFIRLTPPYMMMIGIALLHSTWYDKISQFYVTENPNETCTKYWWTNLLYINNLLGHNKMCLKWTWYLASDMQFFIIGLILLILSTIYFYTAVALLGALLIGSITLSGYISYIQGYIPTIDEQYRVLDVLYFPPWIRIGPYIIGMITGHILTRYITRITFKRKTVILCWSFGITCNILVLFGLAKRMSVLSTAIYVALNRTIWAIGIACIVIAYSTNHGGIVKEILTSKIWIPFAKLTYCVYLMNPIVIHSISLYNETSVHLNLLYTGTMVLGYIVVSYICAYVLFLMAELPYILLIQKFIQSRSPQEKKNKASSMRKRKII